jgi:hypothetical protein
LTVAATAAVERSSTRATRRVDRRGDVAGGALVGARLDNAVAVIALDAVLDLGGAGLFSASADPRDRGDDRQRNDAEHDQTGARHAAAARQRRRSTLPIRCATHPR